MDPYEFEEFVADLWEARGWNARVTQGSADRGVDVVATQADPFSKKHVIQAKRYANTVSSPEIQQYASLRQQEVDVDAVVIVTTGEFSSQAKSVARDLNVKRVNIDDLYELVTSNGGREVYDDYFEGAAPVTRWAMPGAGPAQRGAPAGHTGPDAPVTARWHFDTDGPIWCESSPAVADGTVYVATGDFVTQTGSGLYAVDAVTGTKQWQFDAFDDALGSPVVVDGTVYVGCGSATDDSNSLYAVDAVTGTKQWQFRTGGLVSSPAVADRTAYVGANGSLYAVDAVTGTKQWQFDTGGSVTSPVVADGTVYVGGYDNGLYAVDATTGTKQWQFDTSGSVKSSPAVVDGTVYAGSHGNSLYAVDAATGEQQWRFDTDGVVEWSPAVADGTVYVGIIGSLYAVNAVTGTKQWQFDTDVNVSSPAVVDGTVYYTGNSDGGLYAVNAVTGTKQWQFGTGGVAGWSSPVVVDGTVYAGSFGNGLYAVEEKE